MKREAGDLPGAASRGPGRRCPRNGRRVKLDQQATAFQRGKAVQPVPGTPREPGDRPEIQRGDVQPPAHPPGWFARSPAAASRLCQAVGRAGGALLEHVVNHILSAYPRTPVAGNPPATALAPALSPRLVFELS